MSAHTACSRDDPVPKSGPATSTLPRLNGSTLRTNCSSPRQAANRPSSKPVRLTRLRQTAGMIWSVSTLDLRRGTPMPVCSVIASIAVDSLTRWWLAGAGKRSEVFRRGQRAPHGCGGRHERGHEVGPAALALPAFEVAVRGGGAALTRLQLVRVHAEAHRATRLPPFGTRVDEDLVQALLLGGLTHPHRAGHDQHAHAVGDLLAPQH